MYPIISMLITYDSTKAITLSQKDHKTFYVKMYDLETYDLTFEEEIGGEDATYVKVKEVE